MNLNPSPFLTENDFWFKLLRSQGNTSESKLDNKTSYSAKGLSDLYVYSACLITILNYIKEQNWLSVQKDKSLESTTTYAEFLTPFFNRELLHIAFAKDFILSLEMSEHKKVSERSSDIINNVFSVVSNLNQKERKAFTIESLLKMKEIFLYEEFLQVESKEGLIHQGPCFYRTFDRLDEVLNLEYHLDQNMKVDHKSSERLYQGSGVTVQSGYSTILLAFNALDMRPDATFVDLGSGYGRVGLVFALLAPDLKCIGYEYVPHRVDTSNLSTRSFGLETSLCFKTQDLSLDTFKIPDANIYYLYDPFSKETYDKVLNEIVQVSKRQKITVVTKGNARSRLDQLGSDHSWPPPKILDEGNLCIFESQNSV